MRQTYLKVPYNDLKRQNSQISEEVHDALARCIETSSFISGKSVEEFQQKLTKKFEVNYALGCANGTDALIAAFKAAGLSEKDEVIVPAVSSIATSETVSLLGATPIFCDINFDDGTIDTSLIEELINEKTVGIVPVHLHGHVCDMKEILLIAKKYNLWVIEDCAQAHLAEFDGQKVGTFGRSGTFSFFPGKNLGAMGDAGGIVCETEHDYIWMKKFINHGSIQKNEHDFEGTNSRMDEFQALVLSQKIELLEQWTKKRQDIAEQYIRLLMEIPEISLPKPNILSKPVWHIFAIKTKNRDELKSYLTDRGINTGIHYPVALPFLKPYLQKLKNSQFLKAKKFTSETLSLPLFPEITNVEFNHVVDVIHEFFNKQRS